MSRTYRRNWADGYKKTGEDSKSIRTYTFGKLGYGSIYTMKYGVSPGRGTGISKLGKLVTRNANRSLKKTMRQKLKQYE